MSSDRIRGNGHKLKYSELHLNTGKHPAGCPERAWNPKPGDIHTPNGPEQIALGVTAGHRAGPDPSAPSQAQPFHGSTSAGYI